MTRRRVTLGVLAAAVLVVVIARPAGASSDVYGNVGPGGSVSGLADRYPLSHYALDQHFSAVKASLTGGVDASGIPSVIAFFLANVLWQITAFCASTVIALFAFAFSLDLLNGSDATGGAGALAPVSDAIRGLYAHTVGEPWMVIAVVLAGCWAMWHALVQRRYTETAGALAMSLAYCLTALAIVTHPDQTIGQASRLTNQLSTAFLSVGASGQPTAGDDARRGATDQLFALLIHTPWVALNFGGTEHCIRPGTGDSDHDPISVAVRPLSTNPGQDARLRRQLQTTGEATTAGKACVENARRYPGRFLRYAPGSDDRDAEYQALNDADPTKLPDSDPGKADGSYRPAVIDKPVTDAMEKGGQDQRLLLALVIAAGELGALMLVGALSVSVLLSQVIVLLLACFAPVALIAAITPGRGHHAFTAWAARLGSYLLRKAAYSLVLAVLLAVLAALQDATSNLGWLMSFGLQALLVWAVYLQRHALTAQLISTVSGHQPERDAQLRRLLGLRYAARTIAPAARRRHRATTPTDAPEPAQARADDHQNLAPTDDTAATGIADEPVVNRDREPRRQPGDRPAAMPAQTVTARPSPPRHHREATGGGHRPAADPDGPRGASAHTNRPAPPADSAPPPTAQPRSTDGDPRTRRRRPRRPSKALPASGSTAVDEPSTTEPAPRPVEPDAPGSSLIDELRADQQRPDRDEPVPDLSGSGSRTGRPSSDSKSEGQS